MATNFQLAGAVTETGVGSVKSGVITGVCNRSAGRNGVFTAAQARAKASGGRRAVGPGAALKNIVVAAFVAYLVWLVWGAVDQLAASFARPVNMPGSASVSPAPAKTSKPAATAPAPAVPVPAPVAVEAPVRHAVAPKKVAPAQAAAAPQPEAPVVAPVPDGAPIVDLEVLRSLQQRM